MTQSYYTGSPQPFWHQGLVSWKTVFPQIMVGGSLGMIQKHYDYYALYFYHYYYIGSSDHQALDPRGWGPLGTEYIKIH